MKNVVMYARVSTLTQKANDTIDTQILTLKSYCKNHNLNVVDTYMDKGISGASETRVVALVKYLQDHSDIDCMVFTYADRIARDTFLQLWIEKECKKLDIELISTEQDLFNNDNGEPMKQAMREMMAVFASLEKNIITKRLSNGRKHKAIARGVKSQGNCPLGYDYEGKTTKDKKVVVNVEEAEIVKMIFKTFLDTHSTTRTAKAVNEAGHTTKRSKAFSKQSIQNILMNDFYTGILAYNEEERTGKHEAIISKHLFTKVQNLFNMIFR